MFELEQAQVLPLLPAPLHNKLAELETALGRPVKFLVDSKLRSAGSCSPEGIIKLRPDSMQNSSVLGEEIMHLDRRRLLYPVIRPQQQACDEKYADVVNGLSGFFEEHAFFPFLEGLGLDPRSLISPNIEQYASRLPEMLPRIERDWAPAAKRVVLAALFVQTNLMAPESPAKTQLLEMFDQPMLTTYAELGRSVGDEISAARDEIPQQVRVRMQRCVEHLALTADAATVEIVPLSTGRPNGL
jgi:hypothetical protein